ncbi:MAG: RNA polymerase factor sigma-54 [Spirochaetaceae bacterium]|nr:RNA polymerase factor sigma-54 [Spirochaetaceae bacterium]
MQLQPSFIQEQRQVLGPQILQSIKIMELPILELRTKIAEEIERNPALELTRDPLMVSLESLAQKSKEEHEYFETTSDSGFVKQGNTDSNYQRFIEGVPARTETLQEHLLWQLRLQPVHETIRHIGETLIQNLDSNGFHQEPVAALLAAYRQQDIQQALELVQAFEPVGCCTQGYEESLQVQSRLLFKDYEGMDKALTYLEALERGKYAEVAKKIGRSLAQTQTLFECIKKLNPFPGRAFDSSSTRYVIPDIQVIQREGEFVILLNHEEIPVLGINPFFMAIANQEEDKYSRNFARENIKEAQWFINTINRRNHTLMRVTRALVEFQRSFFINGPQYLAPLTLKDVAKTLDVHETTVLRTAHGKYLRSDWGIFELRYFFTNSISGAGSSGSRYSKEGVKEIIKELICGDARNCSDQEIAGLLAKRGIALARRTVAKYRKELDMGPSYTR